MAWVAVTKAAEEQAGAIARSQLYAAGEYRQSVHRRCSAGAIDPLGCDVFAIAGSPDTLDRRRWFGLLAAGEGSHLSHEAGAELHRVDGILRGLVVVTAAHPHHVCIPGVTLHQLDDVAPHHLMVVDGFPVTTPARTIVDLAAVVSPLRLGTAVEYVIVHRLTTLSELAAVLREIRRQGKRGVRKLVQVLDARTGKPIPESELERLLLWATEIARLEVVRQFPLPWAHEPIEGLVDVAIPASKMLLEADGRPWHTRLNDMAKDRRRDVEAARAGWLTMRFVAEDLRDTRAVADAIVDAHRSRVPPSHM